MALKFEFSGGSGGGSVHSMGSRQVKLSGKFMVPSSLQIKDTSLP